MLTSPRLRPKPIDKFAFTTGGDAEMSKNACVIFEMKDVNRQGTYWHVGKCIVEQEHRHIRL